MENNKLIDNLDFLNKEELEDLGEYFKLASRIGFLQEYKKMFKDKGYGEYGSLVNAIMNKVKHDPNKELSEAISQFTLDEWIEEIDVQLHQLYDSKIKLILEKVIAASYCNEYLNSLVKSWEEKAGVNNDEN